MKNSKRKRIIGALLRMVHKDHTLCYPTCGSWSAEKQQVMDMLKKLGMSFPCVVDINKLSQELEDR